MDERGGEETVLGGVAARDVERRRSTRRGRRGSRYSPLGEFSQKGQANGSRAGAEVDDHGRDRAAARELLQGHVDKLFGLGARNEHAIVDVEVERAKGPVANDVLKGLAVEAPSGGEPQRRTGVRVATRHELLDEPARLAPFDARGDELGDELVVNVRHSRPVGVRACPRAARRRRDRDHRPTRRPGSSSSS